MSDSARTAKSTSAWLCFVASLLWLCAAVFFFSDASCPLEAFWWLALSGLSFGYVWILVSLLCPSLLARPTRWRWSSLPLAGFLATVMSVTDRGFNFRVYLSEAALDNFAADLRSDTATDQPPEWVGLFHVQHVQRYDGGIYLFTSSGFLDMYGVAHIPDGSKVAPRMSVSHVHGPWYHFRWRF